MIALLCPALCAGCGAASAKTPQQTEHGHEINTGPAAEGSTSDEAAQASDAGENIPTIEKDCCAPDTDETDIDESDADDPEATERQISSLFAMDTFIDLTVFGMHRAEACEAAKREIFRLEKLFTSEGGESEIARLNQSGAAELSDESAYLIGRALDFAGETDGAFDIAIYPLMALWGFNTDEPAVPEKSDIDAVLPLCDTGLVEFDHSTGEIRLTENGVKLDLGGIAKGYTSERLIELLRAQGVKSAMVNLGGNVQTLGRKPDGSEWRIAVRDPYGDGMLGVISLHDKAAITSGGYERYFEEDGRTYHHILDPSTGYPAESGLASVTIVSGDGTLADALSTSLFILGADGAADYWRVHDDAFEFVIYAEDGTLYVSEGLTESFESELPYTVISRDG